jgi:hypothetical protein
MTRLSASFRRYAPSKVDPHVLADEEAVLDLKNRRLYLGTAVYELVSLFHPAMGDITDAPNAHELATGFVVMIDEILHGYSVENFPRPRGH